MTNETALQILANALNQATFTGTIAQISQLGAEADKAIKFLVDALKPKEAASE